VNIEIDRVKIDRGERWIGVVGVVRSSVRWLQRSSLGVYSYEVNSARSFVAPFQYPFARSKLHKAFVVVVIARSRSVGFAESVKLLCSIDVVSRTQILELFDRESSKFRDRFQI
jgi:hypothetical protein